MLASPSASISSRAVLISSSVSAPNSRPVCSSAIETSPSPFLSKLLKAARQRLSRVMALCLSKVAAKNAVYEKSSSKSFSALRSNSMSASAFAPLTFAALVCCLLIPGLRRSSFLLVLCFFILSCNSETEKSPSPFMSSEMNALRALAISASGTMLAITWSAALLSLFRLRNLRRSSMMLMGRNSVSSVGGKFATSHWWDSAACGLLLACGPRERSAPTKVTALCDISSHWVRPKFTCPRVIALNKSCLFSP
mmetsp:Transcript_97112/g.258049  ORF Transcript_97112/g.258049 Transcript_97112/m.258049 type:complete len:252 (+) Transcript_97112:188-943(+)